MRLSLVHWLIAAAVLANAAVYYQHHGREEQPVTLEGSGLRQLSLLSELDENAASETLSQAEAEAPVARAERIVADAEGETAPVDGATTVFDAQQGPAVAAIESPEPEAVDAPPPEPAAILAAPRCWLAGPVDSDTLSEQLTVAFAAAGVSMDLVLQTTEVSPDNWVYLPTSGEQADIRRLSRELRQGGLDNFQITDGPLAGSLSMGLFRSEQRAIAARDRLRSRGYEADIYKRPAFAEQPWITLDDADRVALDWPAVEGGLAGYEDLRLLRVQCDPQS